MSETKRVPAPSACATAGMSSALSGALPSFGCGVIGATRLMLIGTFLLVEPMAPVFPAPCVLVMVRLACVDPMSSCDASMVMVKFAPPAGRLPLEGETVIHGLSLETENWSVSSAPVLASELKPSMWMSCVIRHGDWKVSRHDGCAKL